MQWGVNALMGAVWYGEQACVDALLTRGGDGAVKALVSALYCCHKMLNICMFPHAQGRICKGADIGELYLLACAPVCSLFNRLHYRGRG